MRILLISTSVVPLGTGRYGGIEKVCLDFAKILAERNHQVTVAAPKGSVLPDKCTLIETLDSSVNQDRDDMACLSYFRKVKGGEFDVVHDFSHGHILSFLGNFPSVHMMWDPIVRRYNKAPYNVVCLSQWQAQRFNQEYSQNARVMPYGVDKRDYPFNATKSDRYLFLGKLTSEKGAQLALDSIKELGFNLDIVGGLIPSDPQDYVKSIQSKVDGEKVKVYFNVLEKEKIAFLKNARALIYPVQQDEAHWLVGQEALMTGTPLVAIKRGAFQEVFSPSVCLLAETKPEFLQAIKVSAQFSPKLCREFAEKHFDLTKNIEQYEVLYDKVAKGERW